MFFGYSNYHNRLEIKNIEEVTPRGVVYTLRSVLRGSGILNAHFTGVYIPQRGMFLCLFISKAVVGLNIEQADASTRVFYL